MTALSAPRNTRERIGDVSQPPVAADAVIHQGGIVCLNASGYAVPASTATGLIALGRAEESVDNTGGSNGDLTVRVKRGEFQFANSAASDEITIAQIGDTCWLVDDATVAKTSGSATRSPAGIVTGVDAAGVWVRLGYDTFVSPSGGLLAANNLADLGNAGTARANLGGGANKICLPMGAVSLVGADAAVLRIVSPVAGTVAKIHTVLNGALTTGNATITGKIGSTAITDGVVTITQAGSAAGDVDSATPSAAHTVAVGDVISVTVGGTNDATVTASVLLTITPSA